MALALSTTEIETILDAFDLGGEGLEDMSVYTRRLGEMRHYYRDPESASDDTIVYAILSWPQSGEITDLLVTITVLYPGQIGDEHFHTKGHFHNDPDGPEFVVGYMGAGALQIGDRNGDISEVPVHKGTHVLIPVGKAHRMINRSSDPVTFLSISSGAVGHDYESVELLNWKHEGEL